MQLTQNTAEISHMTVTTLKQELTQRGLPTHGLKSSLVEQLELVLWKKLNQVFHSCTQQIKDTAAGIAA